MLQRVERAPAPIAPWMVTSVSVVGRRASIIILCSSLARRVSINCPSISEILFLIILSHLSCFYTLLPPTKEEVNVFARVCLSVCLLARLLKNACMDLDEMLRVDRCRDMDELINF